MLLLFIHFVEIAKVEKYILTQSEYNITRFKPIL